ncbi:MAG TPA: hypothetical protein PKY56_05130 [Candidatus Kapabacteria bacterium]|nr:hypothetical protein [Candidatus Kapabacteria bacterium]
MRFRNSACQSYYQQADSLIRDKSCYQLVDSMTRKDIIGNHFKKQLLHLNGDDITSPKT